MMRMFLIYKKKYMVKFDERTLMKMREN